MTYIRTPEIKQKQSESILRLYRDPFYVSKRNTGYKKVQQSDAWKLRSEKISLAVRKHWKDGIHVGQPLSVAFLKGNTGRTRFKKGLTPWNKGKKYKQTPEATANIVAGILKQPRKNTIPEIILRQRLIDLGLTFEEQVPLEGITIPDFFIRESKTAIYADGDYWHRIPHVQIKDTRINKLLTDRGYTVLRYWEHDLKATNGECVLTPK
jgi:very-short-patch-repair endonuclease